MEGNRRTLWIIIALVVGLSCCCLLAAGVAAALYITGRPVVSETGFDRVTGTTEQTFGVGPVSVLEVDSVASNIAVRSGESGRMRVITTKRGADRGRLDSIQIDLSHKDDGVHIRAWSDGTGSGDVAVDFEIYVPADTRLDLNTAAGDITVTDVRGEISANTGVGDVEVRGAAARATLETNAGNVVYQGDPRDMSTFRTRAGDITLQLPVGSNVEVDLDTGLGSINLGGFVVDGDVSDRKVVGVIGTGEMATLVAQTAVGDISLTNR